MSIIKSIKQVLGLSGTASQNHFWDGSVPNQLSLKRGTPATPGATVLEVINGVVSFPSGDAATQRVGPIAGSGGNISFDDIPAWVNTITLIVDRLSTSGASQNVLVQLKTAAGAVVTGYDSVRMVSPNGSANAVGTDTTSIVQATTIAATDTVRGLVTLNRITGNQWQGDIAVYRSGGTAAWISGTGVITLAEALTGVQVVSSAGALDAGQVTAIYEG